jgi:hypothetical protein
MNTIFLAVPHYGELVPEAVPSLMQASTRPEKNRILLNTNGSSLLALNFNMLWTTALNKRESHKITHFAMHHSDVAAEAGWLDRLLAIMNGHHLDVISTILPIKDGKGLTSTGIYDTNGMITRKTMGEVENRDAPLVFTPTPPDKLVFNTGLWVCDFTKPWVEKVCFTINDEIVRLSDGTFAATAMPEDWGFSLWCQDNGLRVGATNAVKATHYGRHGFPNQGAWGTWDTDKGDNWEHRKGA